MQAAKMADFFNVDFNTNLEGDEKESAPSTPFTQKVEDIQSILEPAPDKTPSDTELIKQAIKRPTPVPIPAATSGSDDLDIPDNVEQEVESDIEEFRASIEETVKTETEPEIAVEKLVTDKASETTPIDEANPLGLEGADLISYRNIQKKYPNQFNLYDGSMAYRDFYKFKIHSLGHLLGEFPLLDIREMRKELHKIQTNHFIGDDFCTPDLIRAKLDASYVYRTRLCTLLTRALEQSHAWERFLDMLRSKLWKDHDIKGAYRRDGMVLEHISDMESYVATLKGFIDAAKQYDAMLRAAADSLSRQLTCLQIDEYTGTSRVEGHKPQKIAKTERVPATQACPSSNDGLDCVDDGTVISAPKPAADSAVTTIHYGKEDEFSQLG